MYTITMLSGGTTAAVTGTLAVGADILRVSTAAGLKIWGAIKAIKGTKGKARGENAEQLVIQATKGNQEALRVIYDVDPFDHVKAPLKVVQDFFGAEREQLPKPATFEMFVDEWDENKKRRLADDSIRKGMYSSLAVQAALSSALKETMKSQ